jgi:hypothetical protein
MHSLHILIICLTVVILVYEHPMFFRRPIFTPSVETRPSIMELLGMRPLVIHHFTPDFELFAAVLFRDTPSDDVNQQSVSPAFILLSERYLGSYLVNMRINTCPSMATLSEPSVPSDENASQWLTGANVDWSQLLSLGHVVYFESFLSTNNNTCDIAEMAFETVMSGLASSLD